MNWTWPSPNSMLHTAGMVAVGVGDLGVVRHDQGLPPQHPLQPLRQELHGILLEFGGTIVLNSVIASAPQAQ